jgi:hypothetical protein
MEINHKSLNIKVHHRKIGRSTAAMAGLAGALSVLVGVLAAHAAPRGWSRLGAALHFGHTPLIVKLAPIVTGVAVSLGAAAGLLSFYSWCVERAEQEPPPKP